VLKWTYVFLSLALTTVMLPIVLIVTFAIFSGLGGTLIGLLMCFSVLVWYLLSAIQFVAIEGFEREGLAWWWYHGGSEWPLGVKFAILFCFYAVFGWFAYQAIVSPGEFQLPHWPF
jgi:hypothetical protein